MSLLARIHDDEIPVRVGIAENFRDISLARQIYRCMVPRHILDGEDARRIAKSRVDFSAPLLVLRRPRLRTDLQHQVWQHFEIGVERLSV